MLHQGRFDDLDRVTREAARSFAAADPALVSPRPPVRLARTDAGDGAYPTNGLALGGGTSNAFPFVFVDRDPDAPGAGLTTVTDRDRRPQPDGILYTVNDAYLPEGSIVAVIRHRNNWWAIDGELFAAGAGGIAQIIEADDDLWINSAWGNAGVVNDDNTAIRVTRAGIYLIEAAVSVETDGAGDTDGRYSYEFYVEPRINSVVAVGDWGRIATGHFHVAPTEENGWKITVDGIDYALPALNDAGGECSFAFPYPLEEDDEVGVHLYSNAPCSVNSYRLSLTRSA